MKKRGQKSRRSYAAIALLAVLPFLSGCRKGYQGSEKAIDRVCPFVTAEFIEKKYDDSVRMTKAMFRLKNGSDEEIALQNGSIHAYVNGKHIAGFWANPEGALPPHGDRICEATIEDRHRNLVDAVAAAGQTLRLEFRLEGYYVLKGDKSLYKEFAPPLLRAEYIGRMSEHRGNPRFRYRLVNASGRHIRKVSGLLNIYLVIGDANRLWYCGIYFDVDEPFSAGSSLKLKGEAWHSPGYKDPASIINSDDSVIYLEAQVFQIEYRDGTSETYCTR